MTQDLLTTVHNAIAKASIGSPDLCDLLLVEVGLEPKAYRELVSEQQASVWTEERARALYGRLLEWEDAARQNAADIGRAARSILLGVVLADRSADRSQDAAVLWLVRASANRPTS